LEHRQITIRQRRLVRFGIAALVASAAFVLWKMLVAVILVVHTRFLFSQLDDNYRQHLADGKTPVTSETAFSELIPAWNIDWNSCRFQDRAILDSWGTRVQLHIGGKTIKLHSAGRDRHSILATISIQRTTPSPVS
jgi:hypothetical protein